MLGVHRSDLFGPVDRRRERLAEVPDCRIVDAAFAIEAADPRHAFVVRDLVHGGARHVEMQHVEGAFQAGGRLFLEIDNARGPRPIAPAIDGTPPNEQLACRRVLELQQD